MLVIGSIACGILFAIMIQLTIIDSRLTAIHELLQARARAEAAR